MALRRHMDDQPPGTWGFTALGANGPSTTTQPSGTPRPQLGQSVYPTLASRNPAGHGIKRAADHGHVAMSNAAQHSPLKRIKVEEPPEDWSKAPRYAAFVDLTGDSSDDEPTKMHVVKETSKTAMPPVTIASEANGRPAVNGAGLTGEDKMTGVIHTPVATPYAEVTSRTFSISGSSADDGRIAMAEAPKVSIKQVITSGPFNSDDSDSESEAESPASRPTPVPQHSSPTPQQTHVIDEKLAAEKAAQRKYAAELRSIAEAKKAARALEQAGVSNALRPALHSRSNSVPSSHATSSRVGKGTPASANANGKRVETGKLSSANAVTSVASSHGQSEAHKPPKPLSKVISSASTTVRATLTSSATMKPTHTAETSQQSALNTRNGGSIMAPSKANTALSPLANRKISKTISSNVVQDAPFSDQPSMAANRARSHVEKLRKVSLSSATPSKSNGQNGLSNAQREELFGETDLDIEEVVVAAVAKPKSFINLAAEEDFMDRAVKKDEMYKAIVAKELSKAQNDEARAAEQRRRIEDRKAEKDRLAAEAAAKKQREWDEHSQRVTKERLIRAAEKERIAEEVRVSQAKLQESIDQNLQARKAQKSGLTEQQESDKQERVRKKQEANAKKHAAAVIEAEAEAALPQYEDLGELVLEGEPTPNGNPQVSQDISAAQPGQGSTTQTGPFSLNSTMGTSSVLKNIAQSKAAEQLSLPQRVAQEKRGWESSKDQPLKEKAAKTPVRKIQGMANAFFTNPGKPNVPMDQSTASPTQETPADRKARASRGRKLKAIVTEDVKLVQWRDREDMSWEQISAAYEILTSRKLAGNTLQKRCGQVRTAFEKAQVSDALQQQLVAGDPDVLKMVNSMVEAANAVQENESSNRPRLDGGPIKLASLGSKAASTPLWQNPTFEFEDVQVVEPRSALKSLATPAPAVRPTTGGKSPSAIHELSLRQDLDAGEADRDAEVEYVSSADEDDVEIYAGRKAEDYQPYGFQVQRRELTTEDAEEDLPIENQEWLPCGDKIFRNCGKANAAAMKELTTIMPGGAFYANPEDRPNLQYFMTPTKHLDRMIFCSLVNRVHGTVQTTVKKVIMAPRARMLIPTPEEFEEELNVRTVWYVIRQTTIEPPRRPWSDEPSPRLSAKRVETEGDRDPYTDYDLATKRAVQNFVDTTFKSDLQSLDSRSEEKREKAEGYVAGLLVDKTFEGEMEIVEGMEGMAGIREKCQVEEGSRITYAVWIERGELRGPLN